MEGLTGNSMDTLSLEMEIDLVSVEIPVEKKNTLHKGISHISGERNTHVFVVDMMNVNSMGSNSFYLLLFVPSNITWQSFFAHTNNKHYNIRMK